MDMRTEKELAAGEVCNEVEKKKRLRNKEETDKRRMGMSVPG